MNYQQSKADNAVASAGGVVLRPNGHRWFIALVQRHEGDWVLPKGHLESGESLAEAAVREVMEETGISADELEVADYLGAYPFRDYEGDKRPKINHFLLMIYKGSTPKNLTTDAEHADAAWHPFPLQSVDLRYPYQRDLISKVAREFLADAPKTEN